MNDSEDYQKLRKLRAKIVKMVFEAKEGHIPSAFSVVDIIYFLYLRCLEFDVSAPKRMDRDRFILSKGHAGAALYVVLQHFGFFAEEHLLNYCKSNAILGGHPDCNKVPGVEVCSGSLGHGIAISVGLALGLRQRNIKSNVVALVGDGEMEEGSFWESIMLAKNLDLTHLIVIGDCNSSQKYSFPFKYGDILKKFGWHVIEVQGHDLTDLELKLEPLFKKNRKFPVFVLAHTVKGYGIQALEGDRSWHRRTPTESEMDAFFKELGV